MTRLQRSVTPYLVVLLFVGCDSPVNPGPLNPNYYLVNVDDKILPIPWGDDGSVLLDASLRFDRVTRPRAPAPTEGTVHYTLTVRMPDQSLQRSSTDLFYSIQKDELRINLCPRGALCITTTELVGPLADSYQDLVLTHYVGGQAAAVYRFSVVLLE